MVLNRPYLLVPLSIGSTMKKDVILQVVSNRVGAQRMQDLTWGAFPKYNAKHHWPRYQKKVDREL